MNEAPSKRDQCLQKGRNEGSYLVNLNSSLMRHTDSDRYRHDTESLILRLDELNRRAMEGSGRLACIGRERRRRDSPEKLIGNVECGVRVGSVVNEGGDRWNCLLLVGMERRTDRVE